MNKKDVLNDDFLKQFKNPKDFTSFMENLYKRGVETMLQGEMEAHLGYSKSKTRPGTANARKGYGLKTIKTKQGEFEIQVPRGRKSEFEPQIVPKRSRMSQGVENIIVSLYAKGMSNSDIEEQLNELYQGKLILLFFQMLMFHFQHIAYLRNLKVRKSENLTH